MSSMEYLGEMTNIQQNFLNYIDDEDNSEDKFQNIKDILTKNKFEDNRYKVKQFLCFLSKLSNDHHRTTNFFDKIERILEHLKDDLLKYFSNKELFHIFKSNKRILLFLIETKIITIDDFIVSQFTQDKYLNAKYPQYFQPEIQPFIHKKWFPKYKEKDRNDDDDDSGDEYDWILEIQKEIPEDFYEKRKIGENGNFICELIRRDTLDNFIAYMSKGNYQFDSTINPSIYETNNFLLKKEIQKQIPSLIEYSVFFGSIQIFKYLRLNGVKLTPSLWYYAIHGKNPEIIQILEENRLELPEKETHDQIFKESIKCHHNDIADYFQRNHLVNRKEESNYECANGIRYCNFNFIKNDKINETIFNYLCKYDYYILVSILLSTVDIDINQKTIYK